MDKLIRQNTKMFSVLKGLLFSYIITAFVLLILALLMLKLDISGTVIAGGINFAYIISAFIGGFFVGKKAEQKKFVWGFLLGVIYFMIIMLITLFLNRSTPLPMGNLFLVFILSSISGMIGGMVS